MNEEDKFHLQYKMGDFTFDTGTRGQVNIHFEKANHETNQQLAERIEAVRERIEELGIGEGVHASKNRMVVDEPKEELTDVLKGAKQKWANITQHRNESERGQSASISL